MLAPTTALRAEWRPLTSLDTVIDAWTDLTRRAADPNVFYEPAFALNAASVFGRGVGVILVWNSDGNLTGLFPLRHTYRPLPTLMGWTHPFAPLGAPLVDRDVLEPTITAVLDYVAAEPQLPKRILLPFMPTDGLVTKALDAAVAARDGRVAVFGAHQRPLLKCSADAHSLDKHQGGARRRKSFRKRRDLAENADLSSEIDSSPDVVARIFADFLTLETSGWKGRAGTAIAQHPDIERFVAGAVLGLAGQGKVIAGRLIRDGAAIAAMLILRSANGAWGWKVTYDENFAHYSPGMLLFADVTERLITDPGVDWGDSCAAPERSAYGRYWRERLALADRLIAVTPRASFGLACHLETWRRGLENMARGARDRLRALTAKAK
jgi:CelD/BcsL family acetyltransferase involved in cellulose biosynthesis